MFDPERESGGKIGPFLKLLALVCSHQPVLISVLLKSCQRTFAKFQSARSSFKDLLIKLPIVWIFVEKLPNFMFTQCI